MTSCWSVWLAREEAVRCLFIHLNLDLYLKRVRLQSSAWTNVFRFYLPGSNCWNHRRTAVQRTIFNQSGTDSSMYLIYFFSCSEQLTGAGKSHGITWTEFSCLSWGAVVKPAWSRPETGSALCRCGVGVFTESRGVDWRRIWVREKRRSSDWQKREVVGITTGLPVLSNHITVRSPAQN